MVKHTSKVRKVNGICGRANGGEKRKEEFDDLDKCFLEK